MRDYAELVKALRHCIITIPCDGCPYYTNGNKPSKECSTMNFAAADAIEELLAAVRSVVRCKECEWWTKQEASIQGRCARFAIYPTGEFYCASGSKREPPKGVE